MVYFVTTFEWNVETKSEESFWIDYSQYLVKIEIHDFYSETKNVPLMSVAVAIKISKEFQLNSL